MGQYNPTSADMSVSPLDGSLSHHGIKGMHWGKRKAKSSSASESRSTRPSTPRVSETRAPKFSGAREPIRPRDAAPNASREEQLVSRSLNQAYMRAVGPAMAVHVANIPKFEPSKDAAVNDLLSRVLSQSLNRVEEQAGRQFMAGLPTGR